MISAALKLLSGWQSYAATALVSAILAAGGAWTVQGWRYGAQIAQLKTAYATAAANAQAAARTEEQRRLVALGEIANDANTKLDRANLDAAASDAAAIGLRDALNKLRTRGPGGNPAAAGGGPTTSDPIGMLIDMLGWMEPVGREISGYADKARIAGWACEAAYDGVRVAK